MADDCWSNHDNNDGGSVSSSHTMSSLGPLPRLRARTSSRDMVSTSQTTHSRVRANSTSGGRSLYVETTAPTTTRIHRKYLILSIVAGAVPMIIILLLSLARLLNKGFMDQFQLMTTDRLAPADYSLSILVVGLISSLQELYENPAILKSLRQVCLRQDVDVHVVYREDEGGLLPKLTRRLAECKSATLMPEDQLTRDIKDFNKLNRFDRLATLRTRQRARLLETHASQDYNVVVNLDMDILGFEPSALLQTVQQVHSGESRTIRCANGSEVWKIGNVPITAPLYYDTFASVDASGKWWYTEYSRPILQILTFAQVRVFRRILEKFPQVVPMQSCFGGLATYDWETWATPECNYNERGENFHFADSNGNACEHVIFQQCLREVHGSKLKVGIQPSLVTKREATFLASRQDRLLVLTIVLRLAVVIYCSIAAWNWWGRRKLQRQEKERISPLPTTRHCHEF